MGYMIEISESKKEKLSEYIEDALHAMGKAMSCVEQFGNEYGERSRYGSRGGSSMGYRDMEDWDDDDMGERRRRSRRTGRYM